MIHNRVMLFPVKEANRLFLLVIHPRRENSVGSPFHCASQNLPPVGAHRTTGVKRYLRKPPIQIPVQSMANFKTTAGSSAPCLLEFWASQRRETPKHLWVAISHWFYPHVHGFPSYRAEILQAATCLCCLLPLMCISGKSPVPFPLYISPIASSVRTPPKLLSSRLNKTSTLSISLHVMCYNSLIIFLDFHWTHSSLSLSVS